MWGLQESQMFRAPFDVCSHDGEDMSVTAEGGTYDLFINQRYAECHCIDTIGCPLTWVKYGVVGAL